jgi:hypothetical protein
MTEVVVNVIAMIFEGFVIFILAFLVNGPQAALAGGNR